MRTPCVGVFPPTRARLRARGQGRKHKGVYLQNLFFLASRRTYASSVCCAAVCTRARARVSAARVCLLPRARPCPRVPLTNGLSRRRLHTGPLGPCWWCARWTPPGGSFRPAPSGAALIFFHVEDLEGGLRGILGLGGGAQAGPPVHTNPAHIMGGWLVEPHAWEQAPARTGVCITVGSCGSRNCVGWLAGGLLLWRFRPRVSVATAIEVPVVPVPGPGPVGAGSRARRCVYRAAVPALLHLCCTDEGAALPWLLLGRRAACPPLDDWPCESRVGLSPTGAVWWGLGRLRVPRVFCA
jgi:hypothetical protein